MAALQSQTCTHAQDLNLNAVSSIDEYSGKYFSINEWIMELILTSVNEDGYRAIAQFIATFNVMEISNILFSYAAAIAVLAILLILAVALLIYCFVQVIHRCCLRKLQSENPSKPKMAFEMIWMIVCSLIAVFGVIVFVTSVIHIQTGVSSAQDVVNNVMDGILDFVKNFAETLKCVMSNETQKLHTRLTKDTNAMKQEVHKIIDVAFNKTELEDINNKIKDLAGKTKNLKNNVMIQNTPFAANLDSLHTELNNAGPSFDTLRTNFENIEKKVNTGLATVDNKLKSAVDFLKKVSPEVDRVLKDVNVIVREFQAKANDAWNNVGAEGYVSLALLVAVVPVVLPVLLVIATITLLTRFVRNSFDKRRGVLDKIGGIVVGSSGYLSIFIGIYNFLLAAAFFLVAFIALFACMALFKGDEMRSVQLIPPNIRSRNFTIPDVDNFNVDFVQSIHKCTNGIPFFDAIDGYKVMARERIKKAMGNTKSTTYIDVFMNYDIKPAINKNRMVANKLEEGLNQLNNAPIASLPEIIDFKTAVNSLKTVIDTQYKTLTQLHGRAHRDRLLRNVKRKIADVEDALVESIAKLYSIVLDWSPQCSNMIKLYNIVGDYLCKVISQPVQGLWIACVICGVASILALNALFNATKYLYYKKTGEDRPKKSEEDDEAAEDALAGNNEKSIKKAKSKTDVENKKPEDKNVSNQNDLAAFLEKKGEKEVEMATARPPENEVNDAKSLDNVKTAKLPDNLVNEDKNAEKTKMMTAKSPDNSEPIKSNDDSTKNLQKDKK